MQVLRRFGLKDNYYQSGYGEKYRVGTNLKWTPDQTDKQALPDPIEMRQRVLEKIQERRIKKVKVGSKVLTRSKSNTLSRSQQVTKKRREMLLVHGWQEKDLEHSSPLSTSDAQSGKRRAPKAASSGNRDKIVMDWAQRIVAAEKCLPEELSKPEFELQRLAAAAQRGALDEESLETYRRLRAEKRAEVRGKQHEARETMRSVVRAKYGSPRGGTNMGLWD